MLVVASPGSARDLLQEVLEGDGFQISTADEPDEAIRHLRTSEPNLLILDPEPMPSLDAAPHVQRQLAMLIAETAATQVPTLLVWGSSPRFVMPEHLSPALRGVPTLRKPLNVWALWSVAHSMSSKRQALPVAPDDRWIGTVAAQRLLGVKSLNTVKAWARRGILRSIQLPNGRTKVHRDDVERWVAFLDAEVIDAPMTRAELRSLTAARRARNPWTSLEDRQSNHGEKASRG